jgi:hypothetical protein
MGQQMEESMPLLVCYTRSPASSTEGRIDATVSERRKKPVKTHLNLCSELKRRSRIQESSAHLLFFAKWV